MPQLKAHSSAMCPTEVSLGKTVNEILAAAAVVLVMLRNQVAVLQQEEENTGGEEIPASDY